MIKLPFWLPIHKLLVSNQKLIKFLFTLGYILISISISTGFYLFTQAPAVYGVIAGISSKFGTIALILFLTTLIPGILQRFNILPLFSASIVLFRRQIGILMYFMAMMHSMYISTIPAIINNTLSLENLPSNGLMGIITLTILFPVWITSNDLAQNNLGKLWKTIQRLTYLAMITLFVHVSFEIQTAPFLIAAVFLLEITSWVKVWFFKAKQPIPNIEQENA